MHIREAQWGSREALANTQPFVRAWGGREWLFTHAGSMRDLLVGENERMFEPVGSTDSESIFCEIMSRMGSHWKPLLAHRPGSAAEASPPAHRALGCAHLQHRRRPHSPGGP